MEALLKELKQKLGETHEEFKTRMDKFDEERKTLGDATTETKAAVEKVNDALDKYSDRIDDLEKKIGRVDQMEGLITNTEAALEQKSLQRKMAWDKANRKGIATLDEKELALVLPEGRKVLLQSDDTTGGYLSIPDFERDIIKDIVLVSPVRGAARVTQIGTSSLKAPKRTGTFAASWGEEDTNPSESTGLKYGMEEIFSRDLIARVDISRANLDDSEFNLEEELRTESSEQFGVAEGTAFVKGSGVNQPEGVLTNASIGEVISGDASKVTGDGIIDLWSGLKTGYARNAMFWLNRKTLGAIRKLKTATDGQYVWLPGLAGSVPNTIMGSPYLEVPDMPDVAGDAYPLVYGDFRRGYRIVDRMIMQVLRDPFTSGPTVIVFKFYRRVGGQVVQADAIKKQKIATA